MLNTGVIGLGNMGRHHVRLYSENKRVNLVCVCDIHQDILNKFTSNYSCRGYLNLDDMLNNEELDAVTITSPTSLHYEIAKKIIQKGIHVLIEKPVTDTTERANELIDLAKKHNVIIMVGHIERFNPAVTALKKLIDEGQAGRIISLSSRRLGTFPNQIKDASVIIDLAVHDIDICSYLLDKEPVKVYAHKVKALIDSREDHAELFLTYDNESAFIQVNWITPIKIRTLAVTGTRGYVELDYLTKKLTLYKSNYSRSKDINGETVINFKDTEKVDIPVQNIDQLTVEIDHFVTCIKENRPPLIDGEAGKKALETALNVLNQ
ncbi:MAG: Gfo/Idh/MocA family oxidoreductase [bacterium]|nr:Gfo/Idh/MocA family oxidoreductase [bacterium]